MADETFLTDDLLRQLISVGEVDLLVGIPSHNNAKTIGPAIEAIEESFQRNFSRERGVIVNVDAGSKDGTSDLVLNAQTHKSSGLRGLTSLRTVHRVATNYAGSPSDGLALRTILAAADLTRARACAVISAGEGVSAESVESLLQPVYRKDFDFVAPLYRRGKFDGLLGRNLLYPMCRAVFGRRIRDFHSGEFGFSGRLASLCVGQDVWREQSVRAWPEAWMAITAISSNFNLCQSFLGPKAHSPTSSGTDIVAAIRQTVGALFWCLESQQPFWMERAGSEPVPTFGPDHELTAEASRINRKRICEMFLSGVSELGPILRSILAPETHAEILHLATLDERQFRFPAEVWVRALYEFAAAYHHAVLNRDHLVQSLVPLYRGRIYSFLLQHQESSLDEMEADSEALCLEFERQKPYLIQIWKAKK